MLVRGQGSGDKFPRREFQLLILNLCDPGQVNSLWIPQFSHLWDGGGVSEETKLLNTREVLAESSPWRPVGKSRKLLKDVFLWVLEKKVCD